MGLREREFADGPGWPEGRVETRIPSRFDEIIPRRGTGSVKYDDLLSRFGRADVLPMWVADMDFRAPDCVRAA